MEQEHRVQQDRSRPEAELSSGEFSPTRVKENHQRTSPGTGTAGASIGDEQKAIPLCLPNNCKWNSQTRECTKTEEQRSSLYVVDEAIEKLREIKGPVCVVSIAGPSREGKSYILSEAFGQPNVFPLGDEMVAETMGIWLWIVPETEKYKDRRGKEFTVVLLDSEGMGTASSFGCDDNQIFTLMVLLASVLIYNSPGVPKRDELEGLDFITKLSQRIQVRSNQRDGVEQNETELFHRTFPYFLWLLRDVMKAIPRDCEHLKDYFLKKVFKVHESSSASPNDQQKRAESILHFFSGFEAFSLPPPTFDPEIAKSINDNKSRINPLFLSRIEEFKKLLEDNLTPKKSFNEEELVTGEGLAALVQLYVQAINSPGGIPNVQNAWETFVEIKCSEAIKGALENYENVMKSKLKDKLPCDNDELRKVHGTAFERSEAYFMQETKEISTSTTETYLNKLKELLKEQLIAWQTKNVNLEEQERLRQATLAVKKEMEMLQRKQDEERKKFSEQTEKMTKDHEDIIAKMEAKHKEEQERLRRKIEDAQVQLQQLGKELDRVRKKLEEQPSWFQRLLSNVTVNFQVNLRN